MDLGEPWKRHLMLLENTEQRDKFQKSASCFEQEARDDLLRIVNAIPTDYARREFLEDVSSFILKEVKYLINILIRLYRSDSKLILEIVGKEGRVDIWKKIKFVMLKRKQLSDPEEKLLDRLIVELQIPNR